MDPIPAVGEHTMAILHTLGFTDEQIDQLRKEEVI
jgi:crotonobetainyl-CoA:carnitine CoA-transferase CaiB-like acyl-CoA transferase